MSTPRMQRQRGIALLVVMWLLALLAIMLGSIALLARSENLQARHLYEGTRARYAAEAGVNRAVLGLALPDPAQRWVPDGRPYQFEYDGARIEIRITDESGKIDLNAVDPVILANFFRQAGVDEAQANALADAVVDWRDPDDLVMPNGAEDSDYDAAGREYGSKDAPFDIPSEVLQVLGMDYELYQRIAPSLTIYSGLPQPNPAFASADVLAAIPGIDPGMVQALIDQRQAYDPLSGLPAPQLPNGGPLVATGGSGTYSIVSRATLPNGAWTELDTTVQLGGAVVSGLAYSVRRWQDGPIR